MNIGNKLMLKTQNVENIRGLETDRHLQQTIETIETETDWKHMMIYKRRIFPRREIVIGRKPRLCLIEPLWRWQAAKY